MVVQIVVMEVVEHLQILIILDVEIPLHRVEHGIEHLGEVLHLLGVLTQLLGYFRCLAALAARLNVLVVELVDAHPVGVLL